MANHEHEVSIHFSPTETSSVGYPIFVIREYVPRYRAIELVIQALNRVLKHKIVRQTQYTLVYPDTIIGSVQARETGELLTAHDNTIFAISAPENSTTFYMYDSVTPHTGPKPISSLNVFKARASARTESLDHSHLTLPEMDAIK